MSVDFSIIIVNYNSGDFLRKCLSSIIYSLDSILLEIIVVDNNSSDDSMANLPSDTRIIVISNENNWGFAKANNIGYQKASGKYVHFLNPDTLIDCSMNSAIIEIINDRFGDNYFYVTKIKNMSGEYENSRYMLPLIQNYLFRLLGLHDKISYWYLGASVIVPRKNFAGWPEDYFLYAEDLDLFYQCYVNKRPVKYLDHYVFHTGGGTSAKVWSSYERLVKVESAYFKFVKKYGLEQHYYLVCAITLLREFVSNFKYALIHAKAIYYAKAD